MLRTASPTSALSFSIWLMQIFITLLSMHCKTGECDGLGEHHHINHDNININPTSSSLDSIGELYQHQQSYHEVKLAQFPIQGVRKMSPDPGEKFFFEYYNFIDDDYNNTTNNIKNKSNDGGTPAGTTSRLYPLRPALSSPGNEEAENIPIPMLRLHGRSFQCPAGTRSCASINRPDRCCNNGDTCELVNQSNGVAVGCCPAGQSCSGIIGSCRAGYTTCSQSLGGGCCIPGYECVEGGCE